MTYEHMTGDQLWNIFGSFGQVNGTVCHSKEGYAVENGTYHVKAEISKAGSVFRRKDSIRNLSQDTIYLDCATSRFVMDAGEYEVYTLPLFVCLLHRARNGVAPKAFLTPMVSPQTPLTRLCHAPLLSFCQVFAWV